MAGGCEKGVWARRDKGSGLRLRAVFEGEGIQLCEDEEDPNMWTGL